MSKANMDMSTALEVSLASDPAMEAKFEALKNLHALKTKSLMTSIDALQKEVTRLKVLGKDSRRAQMVQALRNKMREYDMVVDVLKEEMVKETEMTMEDVNDLIIKKTTGGPKRFRPLTREELEKKIVEMERKAKKDAALITAGGVGKGGENSNNSNNKSSSSSGRGKSSGSGIRKDPSNTGGLTLNLNRLNANSGDGDASAQVAMLTDEVKQLTLSVDVKEGALQQLRDEVARLSARNAELASTNEMIAQKERKATDLEATIDDLTRRLEDATRNLAQSREECVLVQEASDADMEMLQKELEQIHGQCEQLLKQNTVLLRQLGERELDDSIVNSGIGDLNAGALQSKVDDLTAQLKQKSSAALDYRVQAEKLRVDMRDRNEQIRELKRTVAELRKLR